MANQDNKKKKATKLKLKVKEQYTVGKLLIEKYKFTKSSYRIGEIIETTDEFGILDYADFDYFFEKIK